MPLLPDIPLLILPSPTEEMAQVALGQVRRENRFLAHSTLWATVCVLLAAINLLVGGPPWSVWATLSWGLLVATHALAAFALGRRRYRERHRELERGLEATPRAAREGSEVQELRDKLLGSVAEAREALRESAPEVVEELARGESLALALVAWLDEAERLIEAGRGGAVRRQQMAATLSTPGERQVRGPLRRLLGELDAQDLRLAALGRELERRRSALDSFLLVTESAGVAGARGELLTAVAGPIRERVELLEAVSSEAPATDRRRVHEEGRIREEVRLARELQRSILPGAPPRVAGLSVAHLYRPSSEVGGDYFDYYERGSDRLLVAIGDASGHGLDSSMVSSMAKSALYTHVAAGRGLDETMTELNRLMCDTLDKRRLMTLALVEIDALGRRLSWTNAGQVFPLLRRDGEVRELEQPSYPLGVRREVVFEVRTLELEPGDLLLLLTDGYVEAADDGGEAFGWQRLSERLRGLADVGVEELVVELAEDLWRHLGGAGPQDDVTLVAVAVGTP